MRNLLTSASKIVFILLSLTLCLGFLFCIFTGKVVVGMNDFSNPVMLVLGYYFTQAGAKKMQITQ